MEHGGQSTSRPVVIGRLVLLAAAVAAVVASFALTRKQERATAASRAAVERYVCPMHPEVTSTTADACPICRMALERVGGEKSAAAPALTDVARQRVFNKQARAPGFVAPDGVVEAVFYKADLVGLLPNDRASFFRASAPATAIDVRLAADSPVPWDASTATARFRASPGARGIAPGETGWVTLAAKSRSLLVIPSSAVLESPRGPYVLAAEGGAFVRRAIEVGKVLYGVAAVMSGLREGERVVVGDAFFWDVREATP